METIRAVDLPGRARAAAWNALYAAQVERAEIVPADEAAFEA